MKKVGCLGWVSIFIVLSLLFQLFSSRAGQTVLVVLVMIGLVAWLIRSQSKKGLRPKQAESRNTQIDNLLGLANRLYSNAKENSGSGLVMSSDETYIATIPTQLIESRSNGSSYVGGSQGVSFRIMKGVSYRVGATRGHLEKNPDTLQVVDEGKATFTSKRIVFAGTSATREWQLAKMVNADPGPNGIQIMISVSNRQKPSGLQAVNDTDITPGMLTAIAVDYLSGGVDAARARCVEFATALRDPNATPAESPLVSGEQKAALLKPSSSTAAISTSTPAPPAADKPESSAGTLAAAPSAPRLAIGDEFDIVGESFNADSFEQIRAALGVRRGDTTEVDVLLLAEPFNKYSKNGKAVAVTMNGLTLGHIAETDNAPFFDLLKDFNGKILCSAQIYFAPTDTVPVKNSVRLLCELPPRVG